MNAADFMSFVIKQFQFVEKLCIIFRSKLNIKYNASKIYKTFYVRYVDTT